mmetsp:Transcript_5988/g.19401  ORF Transcript_5988/g.19401 Transcript_5988/m.19401 type:complete len:214 (-) Transcript_5988:1815-2456(-)
MDRRGGRSGRHDLLPPRGHHRAHHAGARLPPHQALQVPARQPVPRHERHRRRAQHRDGQDAQRHVHQPLRALRQDRPGAAPLAAHGRHLPRPRPRHLLHRARVRGPPPLRRRARALELHLESNVDGAGDCPRRGRARGDAALDAHRPRRRHLLHVPRPHHHQPDCCVIRHVPRLQPARGATHRSLGRRPRSRQGGEGGDSDDPVLVAYPPQGA